MEGGTLCRILKEFEGGHRGGGDESMSNAFEPRGHRILAFSSTTTAGQLDPWKEGGWSL